MNLWIRSQNKENLIECNDIEVSGNDIMINETTKIKTKLRSGMGEYYEDCYCPKCDMFICYESQRKDYSKVMNYCYKCGQKLDWNNDKDI